MNTDVQKNLPDTNTRLECRLATYRFIWRFCDTKTREFFW